MANVASNVFSSVQKFSQAAWSGLKTGLQTFKWNSPSAYGVAALAAAKFVGSPILWVAHKVDPKRFAPVSGVTAAVVATAEVVTALGIVALVYRKELAKALTPATLDDLKKAVTAADEKVTAAAKAFDDARTASETKVSDATKAIQDRQDLVAAGVGVQDAAVAQTNQEVTEAKAAFAALKAEDVGFAEAQARVTKAEADLKTANLALAGANALVTAAPGFYVEQEKIIAGEMNPKALQTLAVAHQQALIEHAKAEVKVAKAEVADAKKAEAKADKADVANAKQAVKDAEDALKDANEVVTKEVKVLADLKATHVKELADHAKAIKDAAEAAKKLASPTKK